MPDGLAGRGSSSRSGKGVCRRWWDVYGCGTWDEESVDGNGGPWHLGTLHRFMSVSCYASCKTCMMHVLFFCVLHSRPRWERPDCYGKGLVWGAGSEPGQRQWLPRRLGSGC